MTLQTFGYIYILTDITFWRIFVEFPFNMLIIYAVLSHSMYTVKGMDHQNNLNLEVNPNVAHQLGH